MKLFSLIFFTLMTNLALASEPETVSPTYVHGVEAGPQHTCAIVGEERELWCWGQLFGETVSLPKKILGVDQVHQVSIAREITCMIVGTDRGLSCFGKENGQGLHWTSTTPQAQGPKQVLEFSSSQDRICIVTGKERIFSCTSSSSLGSYTSQKLEFYLHKQFLGMKRIHVTQNHELSNDFEDQLWVYSYGALVRKNVFAQFGGIHVDDRPVSLNRYSLINGNLYFFRQHDKMVGIYLRPFSMGGVTRQIDFVPGTINQLVIGFDHACVTMGTNKSLKCFGIRDSQVAFLPRGSQIEGVSELTAGTAHVCFVKEGNLRCFGNGQYGRLGYGNENTYGDDPHETLDQLPFVEFKDPSKPSDKETEAD